MQSRGTIKLMCADDHGFIVGELAEHIGLEGGVECVGSLSSGEPLVETTKRTRVQAVLFNLILPRPDPLEDFAHRERAFLRVAVMLIPASARDHVIDSTFVRGAFGYFSKSYDSTAIFEGIRQPMRGKLDLGQEVTGRMCQRRRPYSASTARRGLRRLSALAACRTEVLRPKGRGMSQAEMTREVCHRHTTIDAQHTSLMTELDIEHRAELTRLGIAEGLVEA